MPSFFPNPSANNIHNAQLLDSYASSNVSFNQEDLAHRELIGNCIKEVKQKLLALQVIDRNVTIGFTLGTAALGFSLLLPLAEIGMLGFAYGTYQLGLRQRAYSDYENSLQNLISCCKWTLGHVDDKSIINHESIKNMINTLAPLTNEVQLREYIDDKYEDIFVKQADEKKAETTVMNYKLNQEETTLYYKIYGYQQGGALALLQGIGYAIVNGFKAIKNALFTSSQNDEVASTTAKI